jgi:hypothetical protein
MPFVIRGVSGQIVALSEVALSGAEELAPGHPEVAAFIARVTAPPEQPAAFAASDLAFIRVMEDLIEALIRKGVLALTDLPAPAEDKLVERRAMRGWLTDMVGAMDDGGKLI